MSYSVARILLTPLTIAFFAPLADAQIKEPPRAEKVDVQIRYRIRADRDERIRQYRVLEKHLAALGFVDAKKDDPDRDLDILDPNAERFTGTVPGAKVLDILNDVRVQNILFAPAGFTYPDAPDKPVAIRIGLRGGLLPRVQQQLHEQTVAHLGQLGFTESLGYDTRGYTLVRGAIPLKNLPLLVKDVRTEPSGWFLPATPLDDLPAPLRDRNPMRWTEVLPITEFAPPFVPPPVLPAQLKYSADLRAALLDPAQKDAALRVEAVFEDRIAGFDVLRGVVQGRYVGASLDGVIGNVASIRFSRPSLVEAFALEPSLSYLRLPRQGWETLATTQGGKGVSAADAVMAARIGELHKLGYSGAGVKVVLIGSDFTGAERLIGGELPKGTKIVDLTTELTPELVPAKPELARLGSGTAAARLLAAGAPNCDLVLVRIDPGCMFFLRTIIALARGELAYTDALQVRLAELSARSRVLDNEKRAAIDAYRAAFSDLSDNEVAVALRKKTKADLDAVFVKEKALGEVITRFNTYRKDITTTLAGAEVIVNTLAWDSGYPLDSLSDFAATLDRVSTVLPPLIQKRPADPAAAPKPPLVWVQAASSAGAAVWGGPFLDVNRDGLMEFVPPGTKLPADNWSPQLNFLGTRALSGEVSPELAKDAKLRIVVQWREPADPNFPDSDVPYYPLTLRLLRQLDPTGTQRPSDEMEELARSVSAPNVVSRTRTYLVFEQMVEFTVPVAGRYALALESAQPPEPPLPQLRRSLEIYPRVVIETVGTAASDPHAVFRSYTTTTAGVGTPGDSLGAITIGTDVPGTQVGGGTGITLRQKPDVLGPDAFVFGNDTFRGPGAATAFAGGAAVSLLQARTAAPNVFFATGIEPGKPLEIPSLWLKTVPPAPKRRP
jgi:hypothetical protein